MIKQEIPAELRYLDEEWVELIKLAKDYGLSISEVRYFLNYFTYHRPIIWHRIVIDMYNYKTPWQLS